MRDVLIGQTDYTVLVKIIGTDGAPETGLTEASIDIAYARVETDNDVTTTDVTPAALSALTDAHTDWGFEEVSSTDHPGLYRLDIADAVFASGAWEAVVTITDASGTDFYAVDIGFRLVGQDKTAAVYAANVTQVDGAALDTHDAGSFPADVRLFGGTAGTFSGGRPEVIVQTNNDKTGYRLSATGLQDFSQTDTGVVAGDTVSGSVVSLILGGMFVHDTTFLVTDPGAGTVIWSIANATWTDSEVATRTLTALDEDTTTIDIDAAVGVALDARRLDELLAADSDIDGAQPPAVGSVFHELMSKTPGSFTFDQTTDSLEAIRDNMGTAQTADHTANIAAILADTNELQADWTNGGRLDLILDARASQTSVDTMSAARTLQEVIDEVQLVAADTAQIRNDLPTRPTRGVALANFQFPMLDTAGDPATGATVTARIAKDNGAYATCTNAVVEVSLGTYRISLTASEMTADTVKLLFSATGCRNTDVTIVTGAT